MNEEVEEEAMRAAGEFDALSCSQQVELVTKMLQDAIELRFLRTSDRGL